MKNFFLRLRTLTLTLTLTLIACHSRDSKNTSENYIRVGTISGPETKLMAVAKKVALQQFGLKVKIIEFTDYTMPNQALEDDQIDANVFQHYPFLLSQVKQHGYSIASVGDTFLYPMGLYSRTLKSITDLKPGSKVAIPNDPSNEARALLLLEKAKLITLKSHVTINATTRDIKGNPYHLNIIAMDAAQLPRALEDVAIAAINTNFAIPAGLSPSHALFAEQTDSPYMNLIVVRAADRNLKRTKELVEAYQSAPVLAEAKKLFGDAAVAGFKVRS
ncbi:MAG: MetQ/NlpA family ABC transporter substrate-binding protein [Coxiellaceae bacterium]|nr:MetQ/NlpA family ABC transporter substrate-binding protein [Coxiellaceae bacterium]